MSAFDVVLPDPIPGKGRILNGISNFWFERTRHIVPNHLLDTPLSQVGWVPQQPAVYRKLSVAENLRLFARLERVGA